MRDIFETRADLSFVESEKLWNKKHLDLNKKSSFLAADFATKEVSFTLNKLFSIIPIISQYRLICSISRSNLDFRPGEYGTLMRDSLILKIKITARKLFIEVLN